MKQRELPRDLVERRAIYRRSLRLGEHLFSNPLPLPTQRMIELPTAAAGQAGFGIGIFGQADATIWSGPDEVVDPLRGRNILIAKISQQIEQSRNELLVAGLSAEDLQLWSLQKNLAHFVIGDRRFRPSLDDGTLYAGVADPDVIYVLDYEETQRIKREDDRRLAESSKLLLRLRDAIYRLYEALSQWGILSRLKVVLESDTVTLDGQTFTKLNESETVFLAYVRRGMGEWVSSKEIEDGEGHHVKVGRAIAGLKKRFPALYEITETKKGTGSRIVLPLPAAILPAPSTATPNGPLDPM